MISSGTASGWHDNYYVFISYKENSVTGTPSYKCSTNKILKILKILPIISAARQEDIAIRRMGTALSQDLERAPIGAKAISGHRRHEHNTKSISHGIICRQAPQASQRTRQSMETTTRARGYVTRPTRPPSSSGRS